MQRPSPFTVPVMTPMPSNHPRPPATPPPQLKPNPPIITGTSVGSTVTVTYKPATTGPPPTDYKVYVTLPGAPVPNPNTTPGGISAPAAATVTTDITSKLQPGQLVYSIYVFAHNSNGYSGPATTTLDLTVRKKLPHGLSGLPLWQRPMPAISLTNVSRAGVHAILLVRGT